MPDDPGETSRDEPSASVEMPRPTVAPMVLALGLALLAAGVATNVAFFPTSRLLAPMTFVLMFYAGAACAR